MNASALIIAIAVVAPAQKPGDQLTLVCGLGGDVAFAATNYLFYGEMDKLLKASDIEGLKQMATSSQLMLVKKDTKVRVLEVHNNQFLAKHVVLEVRLLDGEHKDKKAFIPLQQFEQPAPPPEPARSARTTKPAPKRSNAAPATHALSTDDPERKAARDRTALLKQAQSFESLQKIPAAIAGYKALIKKHPDSDEAAIAQGRLDELDP